MMSYPAGLLGPIVPDKPVKFRDPSLNRSREIPSEAVGGGIFDRFFKFDNCQPEVARRVTSYPVWLLTRLVCRSRVKFGDSRSNSS